MYYAIIDAQSTISRLTTVAYGVNLSDIADWFADEFVENYEMYHEDGENADDEKVLRQCEEIRELAKEDALEKYDLEGLSFAVSDTIHMKSLRQSSLNLSKINPNMSK